jgi:hypothetical protein
MSMLKHHWKVNEVIISILADNQPTRASIYDIVLTAAWVFFFPRLRGPYLEDFLIEESGIFSVGVLLDVILEISGVRYSQNVLMIM